MADDVSQYHPQFKDEVKSVVVGERNIIYNYYYSQDVKPVPDQVGEVGASLPCPYRGLFHFGPGDAEYFFGRESVVETLVQATQTCHFIPLLGASGSGKSSVVLAGLVPKLQRTGHWQFTHFRPSEGDKGKDPFYALALALSPLYMPKLVGNDRLEETRKIADSLRQGTYPLSDVFAHIQRNFPQERVLLIADQFEELYTLCNEEATRRTFLNTLIAAFPREEQSPSVGTRSPRLVLTMRADFLGNALSYRPFADVLQNADLKLGSMNPEELTDVIVKPAEKLGVVFEAGLVERILDDVEAEPGNLPLLEFALTELWQRRQGKQLTHVAYTEIGEVQGALARHADASYGQLSPQEQKRMRRVFIQLVRPGEGAEDTRRLATKAELGDDNWALVKQLADDRLVVTSRSEKSQVETVELVHEALIRNWGELRGWMDKDRVFRAWQERLRGDMQQWQETQQDTDSLLRGAALAEAEEKLKERLDDLSDAERDFINQSLKERDRLRQEKEAQQQREVKAAHDLAQAQAEARQAAEARESQQKQANKTLRLGAGFLSILLLIAVGTAGWAWKQTQQADLNQANSLGRYSRSLLSEGKELDAFVKAIRAGKSLQKHHTTDPEVISALQEGLQQRSERNRFTGHQADVLSMALTPDGKTLVSGSGDKTIKVWNLEKGGQPRTLTGHQAPVVSVALTPDGKTLVSGSEDKTIKVWNLEKGGQPRTLTGHQNAVNSVALTPDGKTLVSGGRDTIKVWNLEKEGQPRTLTGYAVSVALTPDGKTLVSGGGDTIKVWNLEKEGQPRTLTGHQNAVNSVALTPDGKTLLSGSEDKTIKVWNLEKGGQSRTLTGHQAPVVSVALTPDGKTLLSGSGDTTIKVWNLEKGGQPRTLTGHQAPVNSVALTPDGKTLVSGSGDTTIKVWNLEKEGQPRTLIGHQYLVYSVALTPDGKTLVSGGWDKTIKVWNLEKEGQPRILTGHASYVVSVALTPDGKTLVSGSGDKTIKVWNLEKGGQPRTLTGHQDLVYSVTLTPDGKTLVSGSGDKTIKVWNLEKGGQPRTLTGHQNAVNSVALTPDGKTLVSGSDDKTIKVWNLETEGQPRTLTGHQAPVVSVALTPDGKTLLSGSDDKTIKVWNLEKGGQSRTLMRHASYVSSVALTPDGKTLVSGSRDATIKVWNLETGGQPRTLTGHQDDFIGVDYVSSVALTPDGKTLASVSADYTIKVWSFDIEYLLERSCDWVRGYLKNPNSGVSESDRNLCDGIGSRR